MLIVNGSDELDLVVFVGVGECTWVALVVDWLVPHRAPRKHATPQLGLAWVDRVLQLPRHYLIDV